MLYLCFPITELQTNTVLIGRVAEIKEVAYFDITKENIKIFIEILKMFGILSENHKHDGTWLMGGTKEPDPNNDDEKDISIIQLALDNGITLIDTAQNYAAGRCEELVGQAIKDRPRGSYQILTKQAKENLSYQGVIDGCKASLKRLGVDHIDYFVCHAPNANFDTRDFFRAANQLRSDGLIRNVGVSNFGVKFLQIALEASDSPISLNQVSFSLNDDDILSTGTYEFCVKNKIPIQAFRTLAGLKDNKEIADVLKLPHTYSISR